MRVRVHVRLSRKCARKDGFLVRRPEPFGGDPKTGATSQVRPVSPDSHCAIQEARGCSVPDTPEQRKWAERYSSRPSAAQAGALLSELPAQAKITVGFSSMYSRYLHAISIVCRSIRSNNGSNRTNCCRLLSAKDLSIYIHI